MKNLIYTGVIGVCLVVAIVVFVKTRSSGSGIDDIPDADMTWVKCLKCGQGYEMSFKEYLKQINEKSTASQTGVPITPLLTCEKCGKDGVVKAFKCENCGEIFREGSVQGDFSDRCPKCKHSATEAKRQANKAARQQQ